MKNTANTFFARTGHYHVVVLFSLSIELKIHQMSVHACRII